MSVGSRSRSRFVIGALASALAIGGLLLASPPGTAAAGTATYTYVGPVVPIPDYPGPAATAGVGVSDTNGLVITKVVLRIDGPDCSTAAGSGIDHTFDSDLQISLVSPLGTRVLVADRVGGSGDSFCQTVFDDDAATPIASGSAPFTGTFRPSNSLTAFNGEIDFFGTWKLSVRDRAGGDVGNIRAFSVIITTAEVPPSISAVASTVARGDCYTLVAEGLEPLSSYLITMGRNDVLGSWSTDDSGVFNRVECVSQTTPIGTQVITVSRGRASYSTTIRVTR